ncbi:hypothetical protein GCM10027578_00410 [Spirosoma luteolum]
MTTLSPLTRIRLLISWPFFICLTIILLGYQSTLLDDATPSKTEELLIWLISRAMLVAGIGYGYLAASSYPLLEQMQGRRAPYIMAGWFALRGALALGYYLLMGDTTFLGFVAGGIVMMGLLRVRARWVALLTLVLLLNLPGQLGRWIQANRNYPLPPSEQVNYYEQQQRMLRHEHAVAAQYWLDGHYAPLIRYHLAVWKVQWLKQSSRWSVLMGSILLGMCLWRWHRLLIRRLRDAMVGVVGFCGLTTFLELTSGRTYTTTLQRYDDSFRYAGYYVFDVPDALYLTVAELACLSMALLAIMLGYLLIGQPLARWQPLRTGRALPS